MYVGVGMYMHVRVHVCANVLQCGAVHVHVCANVQLCTHAHLHAYAATCVSMSDCNNVCVRVCVIVCVCVCVVTGVWVGGRWEKRDLGVGAYGAPHLRPTHQCLCMRVCRWVGA